MTGKPPRGLFITGTDTGVGKTYVAAMIARTLAGQGHRVGVYKPVASGCQIEGDQLAAEDAVALWQAAGSNGSLHKVCPQRFAAPLAPPRAAAAAGKQVDAALLRSGLDYWLDRSDIVLVEGAGGWFAPLTETEFVADLAGDLDFPLVVVARDALGTINHTLLTLLAIKTYRQSLSVAGVVLNECVPSTDDPSVATNRADIEQRSQARMLARVNFQSREFDTPVDWFSLAASR